MAKHIKPSKEELEENIKKATEEIEKEKEKEHEKPVEETEEETTEETTEEQEETSEDKSEETEEETQEEIDYKKKFIESTKEAQVLHSKNKKIADVFDEAEKTPSPTDEEMIKEYPDWELMSDTEKKLAKESYISTKRFNTLGKVFSEFKDIDSWIEKVDKYISDPKTVTDMPELDGKQEEFRAFAIKPTRRNVDIEDLVSAFLYDMSKTFKPKKKSKMFETGSGGPKEKVKTKGNKISLAEARTIRNSDYGKYRELLKAGKIESIDEE